MFSLIAQYIGYGAEAEVATEPAGVQNCAFGEVEDGDWTLVEVANQNLEECSATLRQAEEEFQRVPSPSPLASLHSSFTEDVNVQVSATAGLPVVSAATQLSGRRMRCAKNNKKQRTDRSNFTQHRPKQMKRSNQVLFHRGAAVHQKMRQIVHQPRKF